MENTAGVQCEYDVSCLGHENRRIYKSCSSTAIIYSIFFYFIIIYIMQKGAVGRDAQQLGEKHGQRYYVSWGHENVRTNLVAA